MFDLGWPELMLVMAVAVLVLGPNEIPGIMRTLGRIVRRVQYVRYAFSQQFEDFMREGDMDDIRKSVNFEEKTFDEAAADDGYDFVPEESVDPAPETDTKKVANDERN